MTTSFTENSADEQFVVEYKKLLIPHLSARVDSTLMTYEKKEELKKHITELIDQNLTKNRIPIGKELRDKLLESVFSGITFLNPKTEPGDPANHALGTADRGCWPNT